MMPRSAVVMAATVSVGPSLTGVMVTTTSARLLAPCLSLASKVNESVPVAFLAGV